MLKEALSLATAFEANEKLDFGLDLIHETIEIYLQQGLFEMLDDHIGKISVSDLSLDILLAVLIASNSAKSKLPKNRKQFLQSAIEITNTRDENVPGLFNGLD